MNVIHWQAIPPFVAFVVGLAALLWGLARGNE